MVVGGYKRWAHFQLAYQEKELLAKIHPHNKNVTKERRNKCGKVGTTSSEGWHGGGELGGGGTHGDKVTTSHGQ